MLRIFDHIENFQSARSTGFPKIRRTMKFNGSSSPIFETNKSRDYFLTILPIHPQFKSRLKRTVEVSEQVNILKFCQEPKKKQEILEHIKLSPVYLNYKRHIQPLISDGLLGLTIPDKPNSRLQEYKTTEKGLALVNGK